MNLAEFLKKIKNPINRKKLDNLYGIGRLEKRLFTNWFNPFATIYCNFRSFPFNQAIRLPMWIYGRPRFYSLSGNMVITGVIKSGVIRFNQVKYGAPCNMSTNSEIYNLGTIIFKGKCEIGTGNKFVLSYGQVLTLGNNCVIMDRCSIAVHDGIKIGDNSTIAHNCQIMDTNFHFIADLNTNTISPRTKSISIGSGCWICNSSSVMPGACLPDYAIVGSNSLVNKDFSNFKNGCIIAGCPAKLIKENFVRVFNSDVEHDIWRYYKEHGISDYPINDLPKGQLSQYN